MDKDTMKQRLGELKRKLVSARQRVLHLEADVLAIERTLVIFYGDSSSKSITAKRATALDIIEQIRYELPAEGFTLRDAVDQAAIMFDDLPTHNAFSTALARMARKGSLECVRKSSGRQASIYRFPAVPKGVIPSLRIVQHN